MTANTQRPIDITILIREIREELGLSHKELAERLGTSLASILRWENGSANPSPEQTRRIAAVRARREEDEVGGSTETVLAFVAKPQRLTQFPLFTERSVVELVDYQEKSVLERIGLAIGTTNYRRLLAETISTQCPPAQTVDVPPTSGMSAGKNTYTYDAHTYHTKVPPQGIAELVKHYLPKGGLVLDPFAGSGMTGVATRVLGYDCILNELSPAACFIADRFTSTISPELFHAGVQTVLQETREVRDQLYSTKRRGSSSQTELEYTIWSYKVVCPHCNSEFVLWDHCRRYGNNVREHKILSVFSCPECGSSLQKAQLHRTTSIPVEVAYKVGNQIEMHYPTDADLEIIGRASSLIEKGYYPTSRLYPGVNLRQPMKHGIDTVDKFYTSRNLAAMSHLWKAINRISDDNLAAYLVFAFTSLYQRVTRLSEFRFWGGSGNTAHYNVPFISKEANVFTTFERKTRTIQDHLETTARSYKGTSVVVCGSATSLDMVADSSIDLVFTDPPFGANINYSEMNFLWESWLGATTDTTNEAIINRFQSKGIPEYGKLMEKSIAECFRVLRPGHWMLLVFMNSDQGVWESLRSAILLAGFSIRQVDIFDKQHNTFKQLVSNNAAGSDLVIHCQKPISRTDQLSMNQSVGSATDSISRFLDDADVMKHVLHFIHVKRRSELDYRVLYSEWLSTALLTSVSSVDFAEFRKQVDLWLAQRFVG